MKAIRYSQIVPLVLAVCSLVGEGIASAGDACCPGRAYEPGKVIVTFERDTPRSQAEAQINALGFEILRYPTDNPRVAPWYVVRVPVGSEDDVATRFSGLPGFQSAGKNTVLCFPESPLCSCCPPDLLCDGLPLCAARCQGDCDSDGRISIAELVTSVNILLGVASITRCDALILGGGSDVVVSDLVFARNGALYGCSDRSQ